MRVPAYDEITLQGPAVGIALDGPRPHPWITTGARVGVSLLNVKVSGGTGGDDDEQKYGLVGGVSAGTRVGGITIAADWDGEMCPPWWPRPHRRFEFLDLNRAITTTIAVRLTFQP